MTQSLDEELRAAHAAAIVLPAPELGTLLVTGPERLSWLNGLVTCDVGKLKAGQGLFGLSVAKNGKIQAPLWVLAEADRVLVAAPRSELTALHADFDRHLIMEDAELGLAPEGFVWMFAHGPASTTLVELAREHGATAAVIDLTGLGGAVIAAPTAVHEAVEGALLAAAGVKQATSAGFDELRIERALPRFGVDYDQQNYPQEASIERLAVSFDKGCYLGQETVCMLELRGHVKKKLVQLSVEAPVDAVAPDAALALPDGDAIGHVTSRSARSIDGATLALGYVKYKHAHAGTELRVAGHRARIVRTTPAAVG
jgi:folate-binding protein YgfZ